MSRRSGTLLAAAVAALTASACGTDRESDADVVRVAVASNFIGTQTELAVLFESATGRKVQTSAGSTGQLYAQIRNGAPFHVFLSADELRPRLLEEEGLAVQGTRFTYARGRLVLYGPGFDSVRAGGADLVEGRPTHVAIANPDTAPYGAAALDVLERLGVRERLAGRVAQGENVAQTLQFVRSGAAELGFVALSQIRDEPGASLWIVPEDLHRPILQDAVLLAGGAEHPGARAFLAFLRGPEAAALLVAHGYEPPLAGAGR